MCHNFDIRSAADFICLGALPKKAAVGVALTSVNIVLCETWKSFMGTK